MTMSNWKHSTLNRNAKVVYDGEGYGMELYYDFTESWEMIEWFKNYGDAVAWLTKHGFVK